MDLTRRQRRLANLLILPGLGTWAAGQPVAAILQATLAIVGFAIALAGVVTYAREQWWSPELADGSGPVRVMAGLGLFAAAWLWGLLTVGGERDE